MCIHMVIFVSPWWYFPSIGAKRVIAKHEHVTWLPLLWNMTPLVVRQEPCLTTNGVMSADTPKLCHKLWNKSLVSQQKESCLTAKGVTLIHTNYVINYLIHINYVLLHLNPFMCISIFRFLARREIAKHKCVTWLLLLWDIDTFMCLLPVLQHIYIYMYTYLYIRPRVRKHCVARNW